MSREALLIEDTLSKKVPIGSHLLVGVSGGIDSMVLLTALSKRAAQLKIKIDVAHLNHNLRTDATLDAEFVRAESASLALPFHTKSVNFSGDGNIEAWGRAERYLFFREVKIATGADYVVTAHTANDVAETLLMRLISGKELNSIAETEAQRSLLRPFLSVTRGQIESYASVTGVRFREDSSNSELTYLRNRVRLELIPFLQEKFEPNITEILSERARETHDDLRCLDSLASQIALNHPLKEGDREWRQAIKVALVGVDSALDWRVARAILKPKLGFNLSRGHSRRVIQLIKNDITAVELPGGLRLASRNGGLVFE